MNRVYIVFSRSAYGSSVSTVMSTRKAAEDVIKSYKPEDADKYYIQDYVVDEIFN